MATTASPHATDTISNARGDARARGARVADAMPYLPASSTPYPPPGVDIAVILKRLREEHRVVLSGGQAELAGRILRFGTMGDVRDVDFLGAIGALELILLDLGVTTRPGAATAAAIEALSHRVTSGVA